MTVDVGFNTFTVDDDVFVNGGWWWTCYCGGETFESGVERVTWFTAQALSVGRSISLTVGNVACLAVSSCVHVLVW